MLRMAPQDEDGDSFTESEEHALACVSKDEATGLECYGFSMGVS